MKEITNADIFSKLLEVLDMLGLYASQGNAYDPKVLFLLNEILGLISGDAELTSIVNESLSTILTDDTQQRIRDKIADPQAVVEAVATPVDKKWN